MRMVLTTFGTLGDVHPLIAVALEMRRRGHTPVLAVPEIFRAKIEPLGWNSPKSVQRSTRQSQWRGQFFPAL
jgi:UDP:flavonoid glycosyltransferase YjiC (YdhE family)